MPCWCYMASIFFTVAFNGDGNFVLQAREKFLSLRKSTRMDVAVVIEDVYQLFKT